MIAAVFEALADGRTRWRRARNLRAGRRNAGTGTGACAWAVARARARLHAAAQALAPARFAGSARTAVAATATFAAAPAAAAPSRPRTPAPLRWLTLASLLLATGGALLIGVHARWIAADAEAALDPAAGTRAAAVLRQALAGAVLHVPADAGARLLRLPQASVLMLSGLRAEAARRVDLCSQLANPGDPTGRLLPLRIGYRLADVERLAARADASGQPLVLRNLMLAGAQGAMPRVEIGGRASTLDSNAPLALRWEGATAEWIADSGAGVPVQGAAASASLLRQGWLLWGGDAALHVERVPSGACPALGALTLQLYHRADAGAAIGQAGTRALVAAFPLHGAPVETRLAPGDYRVPAAAPAQMEDQQLFEALRARGLVRLGRDGLAELAPPDLAAWRALGPTGWDAVTIDAATRRLLEHLYGRADGDFLREQVRIFNSERRLLAWRVAVHPADAAAAAAPASGTAATLHADWRAETASAGNAAPLPLAEDMPAAGVRLFAAMPQGWGGWRRVAAWPAGAAAARLRLDLRGAGAADGHVRVMLAGRLLDLEGARVAARRDACDGRACAAADQVQVLDLVLEPGARVLVLEAAPLAMDALATPGDARYRHLVVQGGQLAWQALPSTPLHKTAGAAAEVMLFDRGGAPLWRDGAPSQEARAAGLSTLLGVRAEQTGGIAAMLGRLPGAGGRHQASLSIDLALQRSAQAALDCIAMRRGRWQDGACSGGSAPPSGRQAGIVVLDTETGAILAAAGAGNAPVDNANWTEARDFDRIDPATSPLRLPAFQHDGGANRSPGSTFKIVSALGLELAAQADPQLDALLDGLPLAGINAYARRRGWAFRTEAATYPVDGRARITNFRDQGLDRRAQDGRLGLAQALTYSLNTWFAWAGELSDRSLLKRPDGGAPDLQPLEAGALDGVRPIVAMAHRLGFGAALRLDGGLLPPDYAWSSWDALQTTPAGIDPVHTRHELRQMAIGLRMQATPLQMALAAGAVGQGRVIHPRLLATLDGRRAQDTQGAPGDALGVRLDRIRAGMKGVVDVGTAAGAFRAPELAGVRRGLSGKTGTAPVGDGSQATVWFTGWLEPGSLPRQNHRLALAVFVSHSEATGGEHAAPVAAALLGSQAARKLNLNAR
ncbi:penicillin-binding transpeptidase domain-containing protein [Massilia sp. 9096]|uniref:penicillin-binding transpeptidase domain-containing protein n=1 Tax=Massilia sp. 9096 TaxID=1500894 RepID=UPI00055E4649|nr:penicillin-binding transpeptidase domain-containing protein [Massilia sp. 9096]